MKKLIYTNENRLKLQIGYNEDWAKDGKPCYRGTEKSV